MNSPGAGAERRYQEVKEDVAGGETEGGKGIGVLMPTELEVVLRVPRAKESIRDASGYPIDNGSERFIARILVESLPKVGDPLTLTAKSCDAFGGSVTPVEWHDDKNMFAVYCQFSN